MSHVSSYQEARRRRDSLLQRVFDREREVTCATYFKPSWSSDRARLESTEFTFCGWEVDFDVDDNGPPLHRPMPWFARVSCLECLMVETA